jgi:lactate permease
MGIPVVVLAEVSDLPLAALAHQQALIAAGLFAGFPAWLTVTFGGWPALRRLWLHAAAAGIAYAVVIWWVAGQISLYPAGLAASVASLLAIVAVVNWSGQNRRHGEQALSLKNVLTPWWPYLLLMVLVTAWSVPPLNGWLNRLTVTVPMPALPSSSGIRLDLAASPGTAILLAALLIGGAARISAAGWRQAGLTTLRQLRYPLINMMAMLALAQIMNFSGMTAALGLAVASTGQVFPLISPYLSWLGAAIAGSNTAANAMLGQLQATTASQLGLEPLTVVALAGAAAPLGKMVAPQVLSAASSAGGLVNMEGKLLRIGLFHSLIWTGFIALVGWIAAAWG